MYKIPIAELKQKIIRSGKITPVALEGRLKDKINELSGLISEEGAAHIIANELGIELFNAAQEKLKIKEVYAGMRNISTVGKVIRKYEVREFAKGAGTGKVCSIVIGDETDTIRVVFWNDQVSLADQLREQDVLSIKNASVRENNNGREIHINEHTNVAANPIGETVTAVRTPASPRKKISELADGQENIEIMGTVVQIFDLHFFQICPNCNKRLHEIEGTLQCPEHKAVRPGLSYVLNVILDDGTGTVRTTFWKNQTNHLLNKNESEVSQYYQNLAAFENIKTDLLGEQLKVTGRAKHNEMFNRLEFSVQFVQKAVPEEELIRLESVA